MMLGAGKAGGDLTSPKHDHVLPYHLSKEAAQDENFSCWQFCFINIKTITEPRQQ